jgi:hypothetical protein
VNRDAGVTAGGGGHQGHLHNPGSFTFLQHKEDRRRVWGRSSFYNTKGIEERYGDRSSFYNNKSIEESYGTGRLSATQGVPKRGMAQVAVQKHKEYRRGVWGRSSFYNTKSIERGWGQIVFLLAILRGG